MKIDDEESRVGRCAIVGRPNVGKSTLVNALVGQKLAITAAQPGTTRQCLLGVYVSKTPPMQIAFVDTPGLHRPKSALAKAVTEQAKVGVMDADVILWVTDASASSDNKIHPGDEAVLRFLQDADGIPVVIAFNKVDKIRDKARLLPILEGYNAAFSFRAMVPVSATKEIQLDRLVRELRECLPVGDISNPDVVTDRPERYFAAEFIRESILRRTRQEVPHGVAVQIEEYKENARNTHIQATIYAEKASHKKILIGAGGQSLKQIGIDARLELEAFLDRPVVLKLWVKVVSNWTQDPAKVKELVFSEIP